MTANKFLSTLSLRRATICSPNASSSAYISIHALLAESDYTDLDSSYGALISIHALLAESDANTTGAETAHEDFYPRSPCGERLWRIPI